LNANDSEQYSWRNYLRIKGLNIPQGDGQDYRKVVVKFVRGTLSLPIEENDVEVVHPLHTRTTATPAHGDNLHASQPTRRKDVTLMVRFELEMFVIKVISRRKVLKGTNRTTVEDLTSLSIETMNRAKTRTSEKT
jgi:hypothetical protein